jgi:hypothetical protein
MLTVQSISARVIALLVVGIVTWWVVAPKSYISCIRRVPWLWMSTYPMNTKAWFLGYLRLFGVFIWVVMLVGLYRRFHPH